MKKIIYAVFLVVELSCLSYGVETICLDFPDGTRERIEDSVISLDEWIHTAVLQKRYRCEERIVKKGITLSIEKEEMIPAGREAIIEKHMNSPDYQNRKDRDKEQKEKMKR